jgi:hypothetical protein
MFHVISGNGPVAVYSTNADGWWKIYRAGSWIRTQTAIIVTTMAVWETGTFFGKNQAVLPRCVPRNRRLWNILLVARRCSLNTNTHFASAQCPVHTHSMQIRCVSTDDFRQLNSIQHTRRAIPGRRGLFCINSQPKLCLGGPNSLCWLSFEPSYST